MCGIVAVLDPTRELNPEILAAMRDRLAHRGPDGYRSWVGESSLGLVGLGHRRLAIIDLNERAAQPMFDRTGELAIVYNGEIYNYIELRQELETEGAAFSTPSDTEVLLAAYERWGADCLERLNGMFAFAIWDGRRDELSSLVTGSARSRCSTRSYRRRHRGRLGDEGAARPSGVQARCRRGVVERLRRRDYHEDGEGTFFTGFCASRLLTRCWSAATGPCGGAGATGLPTTRDRCRLHRAGRG